MGIVAVEEYRQACGKIVHAVFRALQVAEDARIDTSRICALHLRE